jgi:multiple sugar transport system substrate-binding protein
MVPATVTLTIAMAGVDASRWSDVVHTFEAEHPTIHIQIQEGANDTEALDRLYRESFQAHESTFDLVYLDLVWVPKYAASGWLLDLSSRMEESDLAEFLPGDVAGGYYEDRLYRIPLKSDIGVLHYRKDLLRQIDAAVPTTFDDLRTIAKTLQNKKLTNWGYVWQGRAYEGLVAMFTEVLAGYGGFWIDSDTQTIGLENPEAIAAIQFLKQTIQEGISPTRITTYGEEETYRLFQDGEVAFLRNWPETWAVTNSVDSSIRGQVGLLPIPHAPGQTSHGCQGGWGLSIAATSAHPDEAWEAIQFLTSEEIQRQFALESGYLPTRQSLYTDPALLQQYGDYPQLLTWLQQSVLRPSIPQYQEASAILQHYLDAALTDGLSPEQAMKAAADETRNLLEQAI